MNNKLDFKYFVPTPDTTANCALSRWNDGLMGLSDFLKGYMSTRQSLEFGLNRSLNIKELLNLRTLTNYNSDGKYTYKIDYRKFGDLKAYICGFEVPIIDFLHPFLTKNWMWDYSTNYNVESTIDGYVAHVFNYNSDTLDQSARISATIDAITEIKQDVAKMSDAEIQTYFKKQFNGTLSTRSSVNTMLDQAITSIQNQVQTFKNFVFGFKNKNDLEANINEPSYLQIIGGLCNPGGTNSNDINLYRDSCYLSCIGAGGAISNFLLGIDARYEDVFQKRYFHSRNIEFVFAVQSRPVISYSSAQKQQHLLFFRFNLIEKPSLVPFVSHDGTNVPLSEQNLTIEWSYQNEYKSASYIPGLKQSSYWDKDEECPIYYDDEGNTHLMTLENNIDFMGGRDYTFWSSPVQKTENGYRFECCIPLAFYNELSDSYSNEYYATKQHEGIEIGQVMYRVPVVKRMRQNIEEAVVNTQLANGLINITKASDGTDGEENDAENDNTVILGGVVVDDFTEGLYTVVDSQEIATEINYGDVKLSRIKDENGNYNTDLLDALYNYSETGSLSYRSTTIPDEGRSIDLITMFDVLKYLAGDKPLGYQSFVINGINSDDVRITAESALDIEAGSELNLKAVDNIDIYSPNVRIRSKDNDLYIYSTKTSSTSSAIIDISSYNHFDSVMSQIKLDQSIDIKSEGEVSTTDEENLYSVLISSEKGQLMLGKTNDNNYDFVSQRVDDVTDSAKESVMLTTNTPQWNVRLKKGSITGGIFFQRLDNRWSISSTDGTYTCYCDLGCERRPWERTYSELFISNDGTQLDLENRGVANMNPRVSNSKVYVPIGGIIAVYVGGSFFSNFTSSVEAGVRLTITGSDTVNTVKFNGTSITVGSNTIAAGIYVFITGFNNTNPTWALIMRVE